MAGHDDLLSVSSMCCDRLLREANDEPAEAAVEASAELRGWNSGVVVLGCRGGEGSGADGVDDQDATCFGHRTSSMPARVR